MKYSILTNEKNKINQTYKQELIKKLVNHQYVQKNFEYLFIIGGDGSFLSYINDYIDKKIKVIFINSGKLGFYSYIDKPSKILENEIFDEKNFINLDVLNVKYKNKKYKCINDFSYHSNYTATIKTYFNGHNLQTFNGNGILIATPLGSTARNKSLRGPILLPNTNVLSMIEVEPINNKYYSSLNSPIVFNNDTKIKIECLNYNKWWLLLDGRQYEFKDAKSEIYVEHSKSKCLVLIKINNFDWIRKLNYAFIKG